VRREGLIPRFAAVALGAWILCTPVRALELAEAGRALVPIRIGSEAGEPERTAARELAAYLQKITGAEFAIESGSGPGPSIEIGSTDAIRAGGLDTGALGPEEWIVRRVDDRLWLTGGAPRGTLYAVYRFLEDDLGVRWWTPWDESVPRRKRLRVGALDRRGEPLFGYRDITDVRGPYGFAARNRLNGNYSGLNEDWGGSLRYGPPFHTHTFDRRVPSASWFERHPEFFSEIAGLRFGGEAQWCLTNAALLELVERDLRESIAEGARAAAARGESRPLYFDVSQNDWSRPCECSTCAAVVAEEGGQSGPLIRFVNRLAERLAEDHPEIRLTTLAYHYSVAPPRRTKPADSVVVRFTSLHQQDYARPLSAPSNAEVRSLLRGWTEIAPHVQVWDYRVTFHVDGDLPRADHEWIGERFRFYADLGVDGLFVQTEFADVADMRDLEVWLTAKLLEDPYRDDAALTREFLRGYYGRAAAPIAAWLAELSRAVGATDVRLGHSPAAGAFEWLDPYLLERGQRRFDAAERRVAGNPELLARVRGARVALDRATLARWDLLWPPSSYRRAPWSREAVGRRYEATRLARIEQRLSGAQKELAFESLARELEWMYER
jgi:hypothetical protein